MMSYPCIFRTEETFDPAPLYKEFLRACAADLAPAYADSQAWTGVRVLDSKGVNRLAELPRLRATLERIGMPHIEMVNFYNMQRHSRQHEHRDQSGNLLFGISRLHLPLKTQPGAWLIVEGKKYHLPVGEIWCLDTSGRHAALNETDEDRVHLVIDVRRAAETERYFPPWTFAVRWHLVTFIAIMGFKLLRDALTKPTTIADRAGYILRRFRRSRAPDSRLP